MEDTAREGYALCTIFGLTSKNFGSKVLELDWFRDATGFVEAIHGGDWGWEEGIR